MMEALRGRLHQKHGAAKDASGDKSTEAKGTSKAAGPDAKAGDGAQPGSSTTHSNVPQSAIPQSSIPKSISSQATASQGQQILGHPSLSQQPRSNMSTPMSNPIADQMGRLQRSAASIGSSTPTPQASAAGTEHTLTVGPGIKLKGEIANCENLVVEGHIEATASTKIVQIAECGSFTGEAEIETADISGTFEGTLTVTDRLVIRSTGKVSGVVRYNAIEIEAGGQVSGDIQVVENEQAASKNTSERKAEQSEDQSAPQSTPKAATGGK